MTSGWPPGRLSAVRDEIELLQASMPLEGEFSWLSDSDFVSCPAFSLQLSSDLTLSIRYDDQGEPLCSVASDTLSRQRQVELSNLATELSAQIRASGSETPVFELFSTLKEDLAVVSDDEGSIGEAEEVVKPARAQEETLAILWAHHLLATSKRRDLVAWSSELSIVGFAKPGYPGVMIAIGSEADITEWLRRIKSLQWYALQVRHQDKAPLQARERLQAAMGGSWRERETMSEATQLADAAGFKTELLTALKIV